MNKRLITMIIGLSLSTSMIGCTKQISDTNTATSITSDAAILSSINISSGESETVGAADTFIELGSTITVNGKGAAVDKNKVTITAAGTYSIKGTLADGQILVNAGDNDKVYIILNGVNITSSNSSPIYVMSSKKTVISLADNTKNYIKDGDSYVFEDKSTDEPNAAIFSKSDLTFIGNGSLTVDGKYKNGITSKDDLKIESGNITVNAKEDGLIGKDSVVITNGNITVNSGYDGIKSNNDEASDKGYVLIEGGTFNIDSSDDALHSNNNLVISNGVFNMSSGDDGIHADSTLTINKGTIDIKKSYEGIEGETITINGGDINLVASDDGLNASGGVDSSGINGDRDQNNSTQKAAGGPGGGSSSNGVININGGYITVNANGDGIDSNGSIYMKDGTAIVNGPTNDGNGSLDYDGSFELTGGFLIAAGSSGMAQAPSTTSTQNSIKVNLASQSANTLVHIENEAGENILTFAPSKEYSSVVVSSPKFKTGATYKVYVGGNSTGTATKGVYSDGTYTKGKEIGSVTISATISEVTQEGVTVSNRGGGQGGGRMPGGQGGQRGSKMIPEGTAPIQK